MPPLPRCQASDSRGRARALLDRGGGLGGEEHSLEQRGRWRGGRRETTSEQHAPTAYVPGYAKIWGWATVLTTKGERVGGGAGHRPPAFSSAARGEGRQLSNSTCWRAGRAPKGRGGGGAHGPPAKGAGNASPRRKASGRPLQHSQAHPSAPQPSPAPPPRLPTSHAQANTVNGAGGALSSGGHPPPSGWTIAAAWRESKDMCEAAADARDQSGGAGRGGRGRDGPGRSGSPASRARTATTPRSCRLLAWRGGAARSSAGQAPAQRGGRVPATGTTRGKGGEGA